MLVKEGCKATVLRAAKWDRANRGLFHGDEIYRKIKVSFSEVKTKQFKFPAIFRKSFYSNVLHRKIELEVTVEALRAIDLAKGFDNYILNTPPEILKSKKGEILKAEMQDAIIKRNIMAFCIQQRWKPRTYTCKQDGTLKMENNLKNELEIDKSCNTQAETIKEI